MQNKVFRQAYEVVKIIYIQNVTCFNSIIERDFRILRACKTLSYAKHRDNYCLVGFFGILFIFYFVLVLGVLFVFNKSKTLPAVSVQYQNALCAI